MDRKFTRAELKAIFKAADLEVPNDVLTELCDLHTESSDGMSDTIKDLKKQLKAAEKERDELKDKGDGGDWEEKYNTLKKEHDDYVSDQTKKETTGKKRAAYMDLLETANVSEKRREAIAKIADLDSFELEDDGKTIKDSDKLVEQIQKEYPEFIVSGRKKGAPKIDPKGGSNPMTKADIMAITDRDERRKAIAENMELFTGES